LIEHQRPDMVTPVIVSLNFAPKSSWLDALVS
jgi:hypothetical protein